jgi:hypothetical protein
VPPARRNTFPFLRAWIGSPRHAERNGGLAGWRVIRACRKSRKIDPQVTDDRATDAAHKLQLFVVTLKVVGLQGATATVRRVVVKGCKILAQDNKMNAGCSID